MKLTSEEQAMLAGSMGPGVKLAMEILTEVGDAYDAPCLVPVKSCHIVLSTYKSIFDAGVEALEKFASLGAKAMVPTTVDPAGMDLDHWAELRTPPEYAEKQWRIVNACKELDFIPVWTCTPYLCGLLPLRGDHLAWTESSAVVFANSILGARTNRETAVIDLAASIAGRTPYHGLHLDKNRKGQVYIKVEKELATPEQYNVLGYFMGSKAGTKIPVLEGLKPIEGFENYKNMGAAAAASGGVALYHIVGITPEAPTLEEAFGDNPIPEPIIFGEAEYLATKAAMSTADAGPVDAVMVGCPHYTIDEIKRLAHLLKNKKIHAEVKFWVYTYKDRMLMAERLGYKQIIEEAGAEFICDTCMIVSPTEVYGFQRVMTDSGKCAYYAPTQVASPVVFGSLEECVKCAMERNWRPGA